MACVISLSDLEDIENRYVENGWISQGDEDRRENSVWWTHHELHDLRIPGRELDEWFDDFYAYIDKTFPSREIPKPRSEVKSICKVKYPSVKDLSEDEDIPVWSEPVTVWNEQIHGRFHDQDLRSTFEDFHSRCLGHTLKLQVKTHGYCRILCEACNHFTELSQLIDDVLRLAPDIIREMGGIIFKDGTFCFPVK